MELESTLHLQQQIAEFLRHFMVVAGFDGVNQFIDLLDGVAAQRHVALLAVPRTTARRAQPRHDLEQIVDGRLAFHFGKTSNIQR